MDNQIIFNCIIFSIGYLAAGYGVYLSGKLILHAHTSILLKRISVILAFLIVNTAATSLLTAYGLKHPIFYKNYRLIDLEKLPFLLMFWFLVIEASISFSLSIPALFYLKHKDTQPKKSILNKQTKRVFLKSSLSFLAVIGTYFFIRSQLDEFTHIKIIDILSSIQKIINIFVIFILLLTPFFSSGIVTLLYSWKLFWVSKLQIKSLWVKLPIQILCVGMLISSIPYVLIQGALFIDLLSDSDGMGPIIVGGALIGLYHLLVWLIAGMIFLYYYLKDIHPLQDKKLKIQKARTLAQKPFLAILILYIPALYLLVSNLISRLN